MTTATCSMNSFDEMLQQQQQQHRQLHRQHRHDNNRQRRQRRNGFHRSILTSTTTIAALTTALLSLQMTMTTTYAHTDAPTTISQNHCLLPDGNACINSTSSSFNLQPSSESRGGRRHYHCRGGSISTHDNDLNEELQQQQNHQSTSEKSEHHQHGKHVLPKAARIVIEFDTHAMSAGVPQRDITIRNRIGNRIRRGADDNEWRRRKQLTQTTIRQFPSLSISFDANPTTSSNALHVGQPTTQHPPPNVVPPLSPIPTALTLLIQTASLLPPLILARRSLNFTWTAIVDYFRGRTIRTTFTKLERAYLRYYEFPAVTRAIARIGSQVGILLGLSWAVRLWMIWVCSTSVSSNNVSWPSMVLGVTGIGNLKSVEMLSSGDAGSALLGPGLKVGLPCHQRGKGIAWLCGFIWIGAVVGIGHACAMALSVWGGPLRLQATAQHAESPKMFLRRIIHHPIIWLKELEEWKYYSSLDPFRGTDRSSNGTFNPDPLLFPATWLPLRWLQIFALAKAFSTNPLQYRWCSEECGKDIISRLMKQYVVQLALGDEWHRVFLGEKRIGLGIMVVVSYFIALVWMVVTTFKLDGGAAAMLIPSVLAAIISVAMNFMIFWNRLGTREQRKALNAMGLA